VRLHAPPEEALRERNRRDGLHIHRHTGDSLWDGTPLDEAAAMDGLMQADGKLEWWRFR
jgi:hypothetical protein